MTKKISARGGSAFGGKNLIALLSIILLIFPIITFAALSNPLGPSSIYVIIGRIIKAMLGLSGSIALAMFVYGGFLWIISHGDPKMVQKGKDTLVWAALGLALIFGSYSLLGALIKALTTGKISG